MTLKVSQQSANGDGYTEPFSGTLDPISYDFTVTINPCMVTNFVGASSIHTSSTFLGADPIEIGSYLFTQTPSCNYKEKITLQNAPDFVEIDAETKKIILRGPTNMR